MALDLTPLRYFDAIVRCQSMSAAGRLLGVSQPTLSVSIRGLEAELGTRLFNRTNTGVELTATGREVHARALDVFAILEEATQRVRDLEGGEVGAFQVVASDEVAAWILPGFVAEVVPAMPGIELSLRSASCRAAVDDVLERRAEFGVVADPARHADLVVVQLGVLSVGAWSTEMPMGTLGSAASAGGCAGSDEHRQEIGRRGIRRGVLAAVDGPATQTWLERARDAGVAPGRILWCDSHPLAARVASRGLGFGLVPGHIARLIAPQLTLADLGVPPVEVPLCVVYRGDLHRTRAAMRVKDALTAYGRRAVLA